MHLKKYNVFKKNLKKGGRVLKLIAIQVYICVEGATDPS